jgi:sortase B
MRWILGTACCAVVVILAGVTASPQVAGYLTSDVGSTPLTPPARTADAQAAFPLLQERNGDIVAWLSWPDTTIDYAVVQGSDNSRYLTQDAVGRNSADGAIFMDYRNNADFSDFSTVLYGHNLRSGAMFGGLGAFRDGAYAAQHATGRLDTPDGSYQLDLVATAVTDAWSDYYGYVFAGPAAKRDHLAMIRATATYWAGIAVSEADHLVILSTCTDATGDSRTVVVARRGERIT